MKDDESPLFREVRTGALDPARPGLDLSVVGAGGVSLLHVAIAMRQPEIALRLVEHGVPLDLQDRNGQTALHFAATYDSRDVAHAIVAAGANPNLIDRYGNGPLWPAAIGAKGDYRLVEALVAAGASPEHKNEAGWSVMEMARSRSDKGLWLACGGRADDFQEI